MKLQQEILDTHQKILKACCYLMWYDDKNIQRLLYWATDFIWERLFLFTMYYIYYATSVWNACSEVTISVETSWVALTFEPCWVLIFCVCFKTGACSVPLLIQYLLIWVCIAEVLEDPEAYWSFLSVHISSLQAVQILAISGRSTFR